MQLTRLSDGKRKVTSVAEVTGMEGDVIQMQEIFRFVRTGMEADGKILGHFEATGLRPRFLEDLQGDGHRIPRQIFRARQAAGIGQMSGFSMIYVIYAGAALTGIMIAEAFYLLYAGRSDRRAAINRRMKLQENKISQEQVLIQLRKERGLGGGTLVLLVRPLSRAAHPVRHGHADAAIPDDHVRRRPGDVSCRSVVRAAAAVRGLRYCRCWQRSSR